MEKKFNNEILNILKEYLGEIDITTPINLSPNFTKVLILDNTLEIKTNWRLRMGLGGDCKIPKMKDKNNN